jgi:hypothetical protein
MFSRNMVSAGARRTPMWLTAIVALLPPLVPPASVGDRDHDALGCQAARRLSEPFGLCTQVAKETGAVALDFFASGLSHSLVRRTDLICLLSDCSDFIHRVETG